MTSKACTKCGKIKRLDEFYRKNSSKSGYDKREHARRLKKDLKYDMRNQLRRSYGITLKDYDQMFESQQGVCAICHNPEVSENQHGVMRLAVDHDHKTDRVRGLLCAKCNLGIGQFADNPAILAEAIRYLLERNEGDGD